MKYIFVVRLMDLGDCTSSFSSLFDPFFLLLFFCTDYCGDDTATI